VTKKKATENDKVLRSANTATDLAAAAVAVQLVGTDIGSPNATGKAYKSLRATRMERDMVKKLNRAAGRLHRL
jgi:hypothetical protein